MKIQIHNCHTHIFTINHVPEKFLPLRLVRLLTEYNQTRRVARFLNYLNPISNDDIFSRYSEFINQGNQNKQEYVLKNLMKSYPSDSKFIVLSVDFTYMKAGKPKYDFHSQLEELAVLKQKYGDQILPFVCADPRRDNLLEFIKDYILNKGFTGIKLYPPLGFYPFDSRLDEVYKFAEERSIPIMTHCSRGGVYSRDSISKKDLVHPMTGETLKKQKLKDFTDNYTDPRNYQYVLEKYPKLKLCFGHFGGLSEWSKYLGMDIEESDNSWFSIIKNYMEKYDNVYADISYTLSHFQLLGLLGIFLLDSSSIKEKILFGSDFYMSQLEGSEFKWSVDLRNALGEKKYKQCAETNVIRFLG